MTAAVFSLTAVSPFHDALGVCCQRGDHWQRLVMQVALGRPWSCRKCVVRVGAFVLVVLAAVGTECGTRAGQYELVQQLGAVTFVAPGLWLVSLRRCPDDGGDGW